MDALVAALNTWYAEALFRTLHTSYVRISTTGIAVYRTLDALMHTYRQEFSKRAGDDWDVTVFDSKDVMHSS